MVQEDCSSYHSSVLLKESVDLLFIKPDGIYVDLTFGGGGHTKEILSRLSSRGLLLAFDQDADAKVNLPKDKRIVFVANNFKYLRGVLRSYGIEQVDGIIADLGVSSHHFDDAQRGFSFRFDAPLDMRMNCKASFSALDVVNGYEHTRLLE
ncbi:MAG: 16S rRNA (cytosine(1402)-N(4))-methyltransferase, partial [Rikenellaceae bacterium]